jgi:hypothetical protein
MGIQDFFTRRINYGDLPVSQPLSAFVPKVNAQTVVQPVSQPMDVEKFLNAIGTNETGGIKGDRYAFHQPSGSAALGDALGKYQVTEGELKTYGKRFLGQDVTPRQYLSSPAIQDNYMKSKADFYTKQGYTPQDIADIHRKGIKNSYPAGSGKYQSPDYVNNFNVNYNGN